MTKFYWNVWTAMNNYVFTQEDEVELQVWGFDVSPWINFIYYDIILHLNNYNTIKKYF